jgi:sterol desaturase/sphingolipid hydroxylase (fatty acid hydroxylase superfamily)
MAAVLSILLLLVLERTRLRRVSSGVFRVGFAIDVGLLLLNLLATALTFTVLERVFTALRDAGLPRLETLEAPMWISVAVAIVLLDLGNYLAHACLHRFDVLWRFHEVHHSVRTLDWLATFHAHVVEIGLRRLITPVFLIIAGVPLAAIGIASALVLVWAMFTHSNLRLNLRVLEPLLITPRLHYVHHLPDGADRNFGTVFSVWDRLLGRLETRISDQALVESTVAMSSRLSGNVSEG